MTVTPHSHHRRSIRIKEYDYTSPGAYFVPLVTYQRDCLFGEIRAAKMALNDLGIIADECWRAIPAHFPFVELGAYVIIPNHVHGVIVIRTDESAPDDVVAQQVGAMPCACALPSARR